MTVVNYLSGKRTGPCEGQSSAGQVGSGQQASAPQTSSEESSQMGETIAKDAADVGQAAKSEAKQSTIDEVRKGVRGLFKSVFD